MSAFRRLVTFFFFTLALPLVNSGSAFAASAVGNVTASPVVPGQTNVSVYWSDGTADLLFTPAGNAIWFGGTPTSYPTVYVQNLTSADGHHVSINIPSNIPPGSYPLLAWNGDEWNQLLSNLGTLVVTAPVTPTPTPKPALTPTPAATPSATAPQINRASPASALPGGTFTIIGSRFLNGNTVVLQNAATGISYSQTGYSLNGTTISVVTTLTVPVDASAGIYNLQVVNAGGASNVISFTVTDPKSAPTGLSAAKLTTAPTMNLSWQVNSAAQTGFEIWRATQADQSDFAKIATAAAAATTYADTYKGVPLNNSKFAYKVRAIFSDGTFSGFTNTQSVAIPVQVVSISGFMTNSTDPYFIWLDKNIAASGNSRNVLTNVVRIPAGLKSPGANSVALQGAIETAINAGNRVLVTGHSGGAIIAYNELKKFDGQCVSGVYIDPPLQWGVCELPVLALLPGFTTMMSQDVCNGIAADPGMVNWTNGKGLEHFKTHDAWQNPTYVDPIYGSNPVHLLQLQQTIDDQLDASAASPACTFQTDSGLTSLAAAPHITSVQAPVTGSKNTIYPGQPFSITGTGFAANGNVVQIVNKANPLIFHQEIDIPSLDRKTIFFDFPDVPDTDYAAAFSAGTYTITVSSVDTNWSNAVTATLVPVLDTSAMSCSVSEIKLTSTSKSLVDRFTLSGKPTGGTPPYSYAVKNSCATTTVSIQAPGSATLRCESAATANRLVKVTTKDGQTANIPCTAVGANVATKTAAPKAAPPASKTAAKPKVAAAGRAGSITATENGSATSNRTAKNLIPPASDAALHVKACLDFNNDGISDISVISAGNAKAKYQTLLSSGALNETIFGESAAIPAPGDYDGTGQTEFATISGHSGDLTWSIRSADRSVRSINFTAPVDTVISGCDFDGDGKDDIAGIDTKNLRLVFLGSEDSTIKNVPLDLRANSSISHLSCIRLGDSDGVLVASKTKHGKFIDVFKSDGSKLFEKEVSTLDIVDLFAVADTNEYLPQIGALVHGRGRAYKFIFFANPLDQTSPPFKRFAVKAVRAISAGRFNAPDFGAGYPGAAVLADGRKVFTIDFSSGVTHEVSKKDSALFEKLNNATLLGCVNSAKVPQ